MALIRFPEFLPDLPAYDNPGSTNALNVVPLTQLSYGPWKRPVVLSTNQMDARPQGAVSGSDYSGNLFTFTGDAGKLYRYTGSSFADVSKGGGYTTTSGYHDIHGRTWIFRQFNNVMIATNFADAPQKWVLGTDSAFSDIGTTVPKARYAAIVQNSLVLANTDDTFDGHIGLRLWFGPVGNPLTDDWGNTNLQSDFRTLPRGREITGIVGGEYGIIFCRDAVYRMTYAGPPIIFQIDEIKDQHGCIAPGSIATNEERTFYLSEHGFQEMGPGGQAVPIGQDKIDEVFFNSLDTSNINRIVSAIDEERNLYIVASPTNTSTGGTPNFLGIFNWHSRRWTIVEEEVEILNTLASPGLTLEGVAALYPNIEDVPGSYENPAWSGGKNFLGALDRDGDMVSFSGDNAAFAMDTSEAQFTEGQKTLMKKLRPATDCDCATLRVGTRNKQGEGVVWGDAKTPQVSTGQCSFYKKARYHRFRMEAAEGWTGSEISGVDGLEYGPAGRF